MSSDDVGQGSVARLERPASLRPPIVVAWSQSLASDRVRNFVDQSAFVALQGSDSMGACQLADGGLLWQIPGVAPPDEAYLVPTGRSVLVVRSGGTTSAVEARDWASGRVRWRTEVSGTAVPQACSVSGSTAVLLANTGTGTLLHEVALDGGVLVRSTEIPPSCTTVLARPDHLLLGSRDFVGEGRGLYRVSKPDLRVERLLTNDIWSLRGAGAVDVVSVGDYKSTDRFIVGVDGTSGEMRWRQPAEVELLAVDEHQVASLSLAGPEQHVVTLRAARTGEAIWSSAPTAFVTAGGLCLAADVVIVVDVMSLWFFDRVDGDLLEMMDLDEMSKVKAQVTSEGLLTIVNHQVACWTKLRH